MSFSSNGRLAGGLTEFFAKVSRRLKRERQKLAGTPWARERRIVKRGIRAYGESVAVGADLYLLRRNVHRLEKGLTMRPVRSEFAVKYIGETAEAFRRAVDTALFPNDHAEFGWIYSVLSSYFSATSSSDHPTIVESRIKFGRAVELLDSMEAESGPHLALPPVPTVKIDDLEALAIGRRSVRWFTSEPVSRDVVDRAVKVAAESPTACNRQPYRFEIFDDPVSTAKVAAVPMGVSGYDHQITGLIVIIGNLAAFSDPRDRHLIYIDGSLAAMGLVYGLEAQGVSSCCINWPDIHERETRMRKLIGLKPYERVVMLVAYGYADSDALVPFSAKRLVEEIRTYRSV